MDENVFRTIFSPQTLLAIIAAINFVGWFKVYNERRRDQDSERKNEWGRLLGELDRIRAERDHALDLAETRRVMLIECERVSLERLGRAVIAEARKIVTDEAVPRPTILPGANEDRAGDGK